MVIPLSEKLFVILLLISIITSMQAIVITKSQLNTGYDFLNRVNWGVVTGDACTCLYLIFCVNGIDLVVT